MKHWSSPKVVIFFNEWNRLYGIIYGQEFNAQRQAEAKILCEAYDIHGKIDFQELLFSIHTYFALLMKFIVAELVTGKETVFSSTYGSQFIYASRDKLKSLLNDIEEGGLFAQKGITNFLEGDFFRWYLYALSPSLEEAIKEIARGLSEFEPATIIIDPSSAHDLLKRLYQYLIPQQVRHRLGEYYTPDWLAELILNEVGYDGNTLKRIIDPACGSGTFIIFAIQRAKE